MLKNRSLKQKMFVFVVTLALSNLFVSGVGVLTLSEIAKRYSHIQLVDLPNAELLGSLLSNAKDMVQATTELGLPQLSPEEVTRLNDRFDAAVKRYESTETELRKLQAIDETRMAFEPVAEKWQVLLSVGNKLIGLSFSRVKTDRDKYASLLKGEFETAKVAFQDAVEECLKSEKEQAGVWAKKAESAARIGFLICLVFAVLCFAGPMALGFFFSRSLSSTLSQIAERLSQGADEVSSATKRISASSEALSSSATEQAAALEETAASIEEMGAMVSRNAENANSSRTVSTTSHATATKGRQVVEEMIRAIGDISQSNAHIMNQIESSNRQISDIVTMIGEIGNKTKVINDIVFQTKLLSFNASVEAARAGEHGKGFAVVAEEVGNLAQMSGNAAKEISAMLDGSIRKVETIVNDTKTKVEKLVASGHEKVQVGTEIAKRCGEVLAEIVMNVSEVNKMVGEISSASGDQAQGVQGITKAIGQLDLVTQQNAQSAHLAATATIQLSEQVEVLRTMAKNLLKTVQGESKAAEPVRPRTVAKAAAPLPMPDEAIADFSASMEANVIPIKKQSVPATAAVLASTPLKRAVGAEGVPSEDDPRFNDI